MTAPRPFNPSRGGAEAVGALKGGLWTVGRNWETSSRSRRVPASLCQRIDAMLQGYLWPTHRMEKVAATVLPLFGVVKRTAPSYDIAFPLTAPRTLCTQAHTPPYPRFLCFLGTRGWSCLWKAILACKAGGSCSKLSLSHRHVRLVHRLLQAQAESAASSDATSRLPYQTSCFLGEPC